MAIKDMITRRKEPMAMARRPQFDALDQFHREIDRLFAGFFGDMGLNLPSRWEEFGAGMEWPAVNVAESDNEVTVTAELPGVDEKDVTVELDEDSLTLKGEFSEEREEKDRRWTRMERRYGSFNRTVPLPTEVMADKAKATFKRGLLTVTLPKASPSKGRRKTIAIETDKERAA